MLLIYFFQDRFLLRGVNYLEAFREKQFFGIFAQKSRTKTVVCAYERSIIFGSDQRSNSLLHFAGGFIGECYAQDVGGVNAVLLYEIGISADKEFGFPASGAGNHTHISFRRPDRLNLFIVQFIE